jgi:hypothetical protein
MTMLNSQSNAQGMAVVRAATSMLRTLGGTEVTLVFPCVAFPDEVTARLGLADPGVEEMGVAPVVVRNLPPEGKSTRMRAEFLMPAPAVWAKVEARSIDTAQDFFDAALGILHEGRLLRIKRVETELFAGTAYLYRVTASE